MSGKRANHSFTLIVVPNHDEDVRHFRFGTRQIAAAALGCVAIALCASLGLMHYFAIEEVALENPSLREENLAMRAELEAARDRIEHLDETLDRVSRFDIKLREDTLLSGARGGLAIGPTEGASSSPVSEDEHGLMGARNPALVAAPSLEAIRLSIEAAHRESSLQELQAYFHDQKSLLAATPSVWPMRGMLTSDFGSRTDPFSGEGAIHSGIDIAGPEGKDVIAPSDGTVVYAGLEGGYGNVLVIDHGHGIKTRYGHLSLIKVNPGDYVKRGQMIAGIGSTGRSTGPHLHYEVRVDGVAQHPRKFILDD